MKSRLLISLTIVILALFCWLLYRPVKQSSVVPAQPVTSEPAATNPLNHLTAGTELQTNSQIYSANVVRLATNNPEIASKQQAEKTKELEWQQAIAGQNHPVQFYGIVLDQSNNPVDGVKVTMRMRHQESGPSQIVSSSYPKEETLSDSNGRFQWISSDATGDLVSLESITKDGYAVSPKLGVPSFGASSGTWQSPVVFKVWKLQEKADLVTGNKFWGIIPDGRTYTIDLLLGTKTESSVAPGDFRVSVTRPINVARNDRYDWAYQITDINGGIIESTDEFMYEAPQDGYLHEYDFHLLANDPSWKYRIKKTFYVKSRGGQCYTRASVEIFAHYQDQGVLNIEWAVNPNGSRNLQP
jgi:hypothetical protein